MSAVSKFLEIIKGFGHKSTKGAVGPRYGIPTVQFDVSRVTESVKADIKKNIQLIEEIGLSHFDQIYDATVRSVSAGRDLSLLYNVLIQMNINGMTKRKAERIARLLNNRATTLMNQEHQQSLAIKYARWLYSGAPCQINPKKPTNEDIAQNAAHKVANEKVYDVSKGMFLNGKWTRPGHEEGCRCISKSLIKGLHYKGDKPPEFKA